MESDDRERNEKHPVDETVIKIGLVSDEEMEAALAAALSTSQARVSYLTGYRDALWFVFLMLVFYAALHRLERYL